jgi:hypothetical protein
MALNFGGIRVAQSPKKVRRTVDCVVREVGLDTGFNGYNVLIGRVPENKRYVQEIERDLASAGIRKYRIISVGNVVKSEKDDKMSTEDLLKFETTWYDELLEGPHGYAPCLAIGEAMYVVNKTADFDYYPFLDDKFDATCYVTSDQFLRKNLIVWPTASLEMSYPFEDKALARGDDFTVWCTRFLRKQMARMARSKLDPAEYVDVEDAVIYDHDTKESATESLKAMMNSEYLAIDTEDTGLDRFLDELGSIQLANNTREGHFYMWREIEKWGLKRLLFQVLLSAKQIVTHNGKFDLIFLWRAFGAYTFYMTDDSMSLAHTIHPERVQGLKPCAFFYTKFGGYDDELDVYKKRLKLTNYMQIPREVLRKYAGLDSVVTLRIFLKMEQVAKRIDEKSPNWKDKSWGLWRWYREVYMPVLRDCIDAEWEGVFINRDQKNASEELLRKKIDDYKKTIVEIWNKEYNAGIDENFEFKSTDKLGQLFQKMGWPAVELNAKGGYKTSDSCFTEWKRLGFKGITELVAMRSHVVALDSFVGYLDLNKDGTIKEKHGWEQFLIFHDESGKIIPNADVSRRDGTWRMHQNILVMGTNNFRHAVHEPSLQNIPTTGEIGTICKRCISTPQPEDSFLVELDDGSTITFDANDDVKTQRGTIRAKDLLETDQIDF